MIFTDRIITVRKGESKINEPIIVYRGDYELEVRFTIMNSKFKFMSGTNLIESENAAYGQLAILTPYGGNIFSEVAKCNEGTVTFVLTKEMLDQIEEVGLYSFQIRLFDYNKESRVSIPPIEFGIEVREPITSEDHDNSVNNAIVGYSIAKIADALNEKVPDAFNSNGDYNKTIWKTGDRISQGKLNKIEDAIDTINQNEKNDAKTLDKRVTNNFNVLDSTKADVTALNQVTSKLAETDARVSNIIANNGNGTKDSEIVDARKGYATLYDRLEVLEDGSYSVKDILRDRLQYGGVNVTNGNVTYGSYSGKLNRLIIEVVVDVAPIYISCSTDAKVIWTGYDIYSGVFVKSSGMSWLTSTELSVGYKYVICLAWANDGDIDDLDELYNRFSLVCPVTDTVLKLLDISNELDECIGAIKEELYSGEYKLLLNGSITDIPSDNYEETSDGIIYYNHYTGDSFPRWPAIISEESFTMTIHNAIFIVAYNKSTGIMYGCHTSSGNLAGLVITNSDIQYNTQVMHPHKNQKQHISIDKNGETMIITDMVDGRSTTITRDQLVSITGDSNLKIIGGAAVMSNHASYPNGGEICTCGSGTSRIEDLYNTVNKHAADIQELYRASISGGIDGVYLRGFNETSNINGESFTANNGIAHVTQQWVREDGDLYINRWMAVLIAKTTEEVLNYRGCLVLGYDDTWVYGISSNSLYRLGYESETPIKSDIVDLSYGGEGSAQLRDLRYSVTIENDILTLFDLDDESTIISISQSELASFTSSPTVKLAGGTCFLTGGSAYPSGCDLIDFPVDLSQAGLYDRVSILEQEIANLQSGTGQSDGYTQWNGKKWHAYGTSMTSTAQGEYAPYLAQFAGLNLTNYGIPGGSICPGSSSKGNIKAKVLTCPYDVDLVTLEVVPNDGSVPLGTIYDTGDDTFAGNLHQCIKYLQQNTRARIVILVCTQSRYNYNNTSVVNDPTFKRTNGSTWYDAAMMAKQVANLHGVPCWDASSESGLGYYKMGGYGDNTYLVDQIHLTALGGYNVAQYYWSHLKNLPNWYIELP